MPPQQTTHPLYCALHRAVHPLCAVCSSTNSTPRICSFCAEDPANSGWVSEWEFTSTVSDVDVVDRNGHSLGSVIGTPPAVDATPRQLLVLRLLMEQKLEQVQRRDAQGRRRGRRMRVTGYSTREISRLTGVCHQYVARLRRRFLYGV